MPDEIGKVTKLPEMLANREQTIINLRFDLYVGTIATYRGVEIYKNGKIIKFSIDGHFIAQHPSGANLLGEIDKLFDKENAPAVKGDMTTDIKTVE